MRSRRGHLPSGTVSPPHSAGGAGPALLHICTQSWQAGRPLPGTGRPRLQGKLGPGVVGGGGSGRGHCVHSALPRALAFNVFGQMLSFPQISCRGMRSGPAPCGPASATWHHPSRPAWDICPQAEWRGGVCPCPVLQAPAGCPAHSSPRCHLAACPLPGGNVAHLTQHGLLSEKMWSEVAWPSRMWGGDMVRDSRRPCLLQEAPARQPRLPPALSRLRVRSLP